MPGLNIFRIYFECSLDVFGMYLEKQYAWFACTFYVISRYLECIWRGNMPGLNIFQMYFEGIRRSSMPGLNVFLMYLEKQCAWLECICNEKQYARFECILNIFGKTVCLVKIFYKIVLGSTQRCKKW